jgi:hypothetical protein
MASGIKSGYRAAATSMFRSIVLRSLVISLAVLIAMVISQPARSQGPTTTTQTETYADGATKSQDTTVTRADGTKSSETQTDYDESGRPTNETETTYDQYGKVRQRHTKTWVYDDKGRLIYFESSDSVSGENLVPGSETRYRVRKKYKDDKDTEGTTTQEQEYSSINGKWRDFDSEGGDTEPSMQPLQPLKPKPAEKAPPKTPEKPQEKQKGDRSILNRPLGEEPPAEETPPPKGGSGKTSHAGPAEQKTIAIALPANAQPGDTISVTATDDPAEIAEMQEIPGIHITLVPVTPPTQASLTPASETGGDILGGVVVEVNGKKQRADKPLVAELGPAAETIAVKLLTMDSDSRVIGQDSVPVSAAKPSPKVPTETAKPESYDMPPVTKPGAVEVIHGPESGNANEMHIAVDGKPAKILAATPRSVFWRVPADLPAGAQGTEHTVVFTRSDAVGGAPERVAFPIYEAITNMREDRSKLVKGQSATIYITVSGPEKFPVSAWKWAMPPSDLVDVNSLEAGKSGLKAPKSNEEGSVVVLIENENPDVVRLGNKNTIILQLHQQDFAHGPYTFNVTLHSIHKGKYVIRCRVVAFLKAVQGQESMSSGN